jgi:hypothetical protein
MIDNNNIVGLTHIYTNDLNNNDCLPMLETTSVFCSQSQFKRSSPLSLPPSPQPTDTVKTNKKTKNSKKKLKLRIRIETARCVNLP